MTKKKQAVGELIYGINPIVELLKAKRRKIISLYTTRPEPKGWKKIEQNMPAYAVQIQYVNREVLNNMAHTQDHQGVVAWVQEYPFRKKPFDPNKQKFILLLDSIQDPQNLGAIVRSAYCTGVQGIIITKKNSAPLNATALKASAGLAEHIEIIEMPSALAAVQDVAQAGYQVYITAFKGENALDVNYEMPLCVVLGSEGEGVSKSILKLGAHITLPQRTTDISYNVSVAAGITLFTIAHQCNIL